MEIPNKHSVLKRAIEKYGNVLQIVVAIEELSELQKELCKAIRNGIDQVDRQKLIDEVVDVSIMLDQIEMIFRIDPLQSFSHKIKKLERLEKRLNEQ